jgi:hypothetical protein
MSKIAEKRVNELGYFKDPFNREEFTANDIFYCGVECYDQAMQDFLQKACEWLEMKIICYSKREYEELIEQFKNYMKNESEN